MQGIMSVTQLYIEGIAMKIHRSDERGRAERTWLKSRFSFSFADYHDPDRMGFGALRAINDDVIAPEGGFRTHPHENMEIITVVTKGVVEHKDSEGNSGFTEAGEVQYMSAGSGITHSEFNPSPREPLELFQIWITPSSRGDAPRYAKRDFHDFDDDNLWVPLISPDGRGNAMAIRQDATILTTRLDTADSIVAMPVKAGHGRLLFVVEGEVKIGDAVLKRRDEAQITHDEEVIIHANAPAHLLLFDVPMRS